MSCWKIQGHGGIKRLHYVSIRINNAVQHYERTSGMYMFARILWRECIRMQAVPSGHVQAHTRIWKLQRLSREHGITSSKRNHHRVHMQAALFCLAAWYSLFSLPRVHVEELFGLYKVLALSGKFEVASWHSGAHQLHLHSRAQRPGREGLHPVQRWKIQGVRRLSPMH